MRNLAMRSALMAKDQGSVPGYFVEHLTAYEGAYIDTGLHDLLNYNIEAKQIQIAAVTVNSCCFGYRYISGSLRTGVYCLLSDAPAGPRMSHESNYSNQSSMVDINNTSIGFEATYAFRLNTRRSYINTDSADHSDTGSFSSSVNLNAYIFRINGTSWFSPSRVCYVRIMDSDGSDVAYFRAYVDENDVPCMREVVSGVNFYNASSGGYFEAGAPVT